MTRSRRSGIRLPLFRSQWIRRYFVLALSASGPVLEEYHCDKKETLRKTYDLSKCEQVDSYLQLADTACGYPRFSIVSQWIFSLHLNFNSRIKEVFFVAQSEREMILWVEEICRVSGLSRAIEDSGETPTIRFPSRGGEEILSSLGLSSSDRSSESITDNNISDVTSEGMHREKNNRSRYQSGRNSKQNGNYRMTPAEKKISLRHRNASGELQRASSSASGCSSMASSHHTTEEDNSSLHSSHSAGPPLPPKPVRSRLTHQSSGASSTLQYGSRSKGMDLSKGIPAPSCTLVEVENESSGETIKMHTFSTRSTPPPIYAVPNGYLVIPSASGSKASSVCSSMAIGPTQGPPVDRSKKPAKLRLEQGDEDLRKNNTLTRVPRTPQSAHFRTNSRNKFDPPRSAGPIGRTAHLDYFEPKAFEKLERAVSVRSATPSDFDYIKIDAAKTQAIKLAKGFN